MSDGISVTVEMVIKPELVEHFLAGMPEGLKQTGAFPGCRDIRVVRHKSDANKILLIEEWDSEEAHQAYIAWRTERGEMDLGDLLVSYREDVWPTLVARERN